MKRVTLIYQNDDAVAFRTEESIKDIYDRLLIGKVEVVGYRILNLNTGERHTGWDNTGRYHGDHRPAILDEMGGEVK
jgi:hypothetical protein